MNGMNDFIGNYFDAMIAKIFKILPMWESAEKSLPVYLDSLCAELYGSTKVFMSISADASYVTLISIVESFRGGLITELPVVRREVFHMIAICEQLRDRYGRG